MAAAPRSRLDFGNDMPMEPGQTLSHYRIERQSGEGGMGAVFLAEDTKLGRNAETSPLLEKAAALQPTRTLTSEHLSQASNGLKLDATPRRP